MGGGNSKVNYGYKVNKVSTSKFTKMLEANKEFTRYPTNFSAREWSPEQLDRFCSALSGNQWLTTLKLTGAVLPPGGSELLAGALRDNKSVTKLALGNTGVDDAGVKALIAAATKNGTLRALLLPRNEITDKGAALLAELLKGSSLLTSLDVSGNKITKVGSKALASALAANKHCTMRHLEGLRLVKFRKLFKTRIPRNQMNKKDNNMVFLKKLRHASGYHTDPNVSPSDTETPTSDPPDAEPVKLTRAEKRELKNAKKERDLERERVRRKRALRWNRVTKQRTADEWEEFLEEVAEAKAEKKRRRRARRLAKVERHRLRELEANGEADDEADDDATDGGDGESGGDGDGHGAREQRPSARSSYDGTPPASFREAQARGGEEKGVEGGGSGDPDMDAEVARLLADQLSPPGSDEEAELALEAAEAAQQQQAARSDWFGDVGANAPAGGVPTADGSDSDATGDVTGVIDGALPGADMAQLWDGAGDPIDDDLAGAAPSVLSQ